MIILLFILSILLFIVGFFIITEERYVTGTLIIIVGCLCLWGFVGISTKNIHTSPTKQDVFDGKAYYQETQIITGIDTIKTCDIIWK